jgi:orotidine-5'-phosphate decarboxylase
MTPKDALKQGANFLVIGRPITEAKNIKDVLLEIYNSI